MDYLFDEVMMKIEVNKQCLDKIINLTRKL